MPISYNEKEMDDTMSFIMYHTLKTGKKTSKGKRLQGDGR